MGNNDNEELEQLKKQKNEELEFYKKQNEITEYANKSTMNFVFLFQIIFIFILIVIILLYLNQVGILTNIYMYGSITLFGFVVFLIFYNKIFITSKFRDSRNFDRFDFGDGTYVSASFTKLPPSDGVSGSFGKDIPKSGGTCTTQTVCT